MSSSDIVLPKYAENVRPIGLVQCFWSNRNRIIRHTASVAGWSHVTFSSTHYDPFSTYSTKNMAACGAMGAGVSRIFDLDCNAGEGVLTTGVWRAVEGLQVVRDWEPLWVMEGSQKFHESSETTDENDRETVVEGHETIGEKDHSDRRDRNPHKD
ncbi:uncharacterized protein EI90DRAFT_3288382 [Cantharellus anzutake]|uniref:uncharacterized protein n=1 Tax=Cantharellus anzutake TaxID=1750568 RepID=UPI0019037476|nr:uncharacterized protein EI90DRAFT_3288382 [Cantharellus anzutake]KAF8334144.1 hypothetical protein EI90DRAFT_3288382 [Cantharellus anzutake]